MKKFILILTLLVSCLGYGQKTMSVVATAYTSHPSENGGYKKTATGARYIPYHTIAVDPTVIPLNSIIYVEGFKKPWKATDTGSAIKGRRVDLLLPSRSISNRWGRRSVNIRILPPPKRVNKKK
jgi:3D (Asp-Asp-Asp) domain-containing protein